jgi:hypothetical protein
MATKTKSKGKTITRYRASEPVVKYKYRDKPVKHKGKGGKSGRQSSEKQLMGIVIGGLIYGFAEAKMTSLPTIPVLGKVGTVALAAHFLGKGKPGVITDVRNAAAAIAGYEMGSKGSISGDEGVSGAL